MERRAARYARGAPGCGGAAGRKGTRGARAPRRGGDTHELWDRCKSSVRGWRKRLEEAFIDWRQCLHINRPGTTVARTAPTLFRGRGRKGPGRRPASRLWLSRDICLRVRKGLLPFPSAKEERCAPFQSRRSSAQTTAGRPKAGRPEAAHGEERSWQMGGIDGNDCQGGRHPSQQRSTAGRQRAAGPALAAQQDAWPKPSRAKGPLPPRGVRGSRCESAVEG